MIYWYGPDRNNKLIIDKGFLIDYCDCSYKSKTTNANDRCCILKGKPVLFNTSEQSTNGKLHLNYLEHTTASFWENKKEKTCQNEFDAIIPRIWRKLNLKAISFEFYNPCIGFAFPFLLLTENMLNLTWYF